MIDCFEAIANDIIYYSARRPTAFLFWIRQEPVDAMQQRYTTRLILGTVPGMSSAWDEPADMTDTATKCPRKKKADLGVRKDDFYRNHQQAPPLPLAAPL